MSEIKPFLNYFIEEALRKMSLAELYDNEINKPCNEIHSEAVNIVAKIFDSTNETFCYKNPKTLFVYPAKTDSEDYLRKAVQLIESLHNIKSQAVFEIRGNCKQISTSFYAENDDIQIIDASVKNFYPHAFTETSDSERISGDCIVYDFLPQAPFFKSLTTFEEFVISPLNLIPQLLLGIDEDKEGVYQILFTPLPGETHLMVEEGIDAEWKSLHGGEDNKTVPSIQTSAINEKLQYKSPDFKSYYSVCARIILPDDKLISKVNAFIANYVYGGKSLRIETNYSKEQKERMRDEKVSFHRGWLVNSHELTSMLHLNFQIIGEQDYNGIYSVTPAGDKPVKLTQYKDIVVGHWACGNKSVEIHLPPAREIPHMHVMGVSRSGKSMLLCHMAIQKFMRGESVFVCDPHGDLIFNILSTIPKFLVDKVILLDFGLKGYTPLLSIRANIDITSPGKASDDLASAMENTTSTKRNENWFGPKMAYLFQCLFFIYSAIPEINFADVRTLISRSAKGNELRSKIRTKISHPVIQNFIDEIGHTSHDSAAPVITRLSHLLLDESSLRFFTLDENKISINDIMENGKLCLINLSCGIIGKQRASILGGLFDSLINNNILSRASIPYAQRKNCTLIKDEFYLNAGGGDVDLQFSGLGKYGLSCVAIAHQYLDQVEDKTREVMATAGTRIMFKLRRKDAEIMSKDFNNIDPSEFTDLRQFEAFIKCEDEVVKIKACKPDFSVEDCSNLIKENCLKKYYRKHDDSVSSSKKNISYDTL